MSINALVKAGQHTVDHDTSLPQIVRRIAERIEFAAAHRARDLLVLQQELQQRPLLPHRLATDIVHQIMGVFASQARSRVPS